MTKYSFLNELDQLLQGLDEAERREILEDYEEHFAFAKRSDKSVEEVIKSVGTPKEIAREILGDPDLEINLEDGATINVDGGRVNINGFTFSSFAEDMKEFGKEVKDFAHSAVEAAKGYVSEDFEFPDESFEGATQSTDEIVEVIDMTDVTNMVVNARNQKVKIIKTEHPTARISLTRGILSAKVEDGTLQIEAREIKRKFTFGNVITIEVLPTELKIELPEQAYELIKAKTENAKIEVEHFTLGKLDLESSNGKIEVEHVNASDLKLVTSNGAINLEQIVGDVDAQTSNGKITLQNTVGDVKAVTCNAKIELQHAIGDIDAATCNAKIELEIPTIEQKVDLVTSNAKIEVKLAQKPENATLNVMTSHGKCTLFGEESNSIVFGNGEHRFNAVTSNGKIEIVASE